MNESKSALPTGWTVCRLEEIAELNPKYNQQIKNETEVSFIPMKVVEEESGRIDLSITRKYQEVRKGYTSIIDGDIIFAKITPCMENGKIAIANNLKNKIAFGSTEFHVVRLVPYLPKKYYFFLLVREELRKDAQLKMTGSAGQLRVPVNYLKEYELPLPPLPEQHRIVAKLEELFTKLDVSVTELKKAKAQIKRYRQSVLKHAFDGKLTEQWRKQTSNVKGEKAEELLVKIKEERKKALGKKYKELPPVDTTNLPQLPDGWVWIKLGELCAVITKGASPKWQGFNYVEDEEQILFVTSENVRNNFLDVSSPKYLELAFNLKQKNSSLRIGDVLLNIVGASIGRATVYSIGKVANINQAVSLIRLIDVEYANYISLYLNSEEAQKFYNFRKVDFARANLSLEDVNNIPIPFTITEEKFQIIQEIERHFSVADETEKIIDQSLKQAERLRQSILKDAFSGKLIPQDPSDEPAEKLLERIKAEREKISKTKSNHQALPDGSPKENKKRRIK